MCVKNRPKKFSQISVFENGLNTEFFREIFSIFFQKSLFLDEAHAHLREKFSNALEATLIKPQTFCLSKRHQKENSTCGLKNDDAKKML